MMNRYEATPLRRRSNVAVPVLKVNHFFTSTLYPLELFKAQDIQIRQTTKQTIIRNIAMFAQIAYMRLVSSLST
jgi:hypothetical protein